MRTTWDGLPISPDRPYGCAVVVFRRAAAGRELLMLHRAHHGPDYAGDWAWTPPSGARWPGEAPDDCARRELLEETGLALPIHATECGVPEWLAYWAEAPADGEVVLDAEHDRYAWLAPGDALRLYAPDGPRQTMAQVLALLEDEDARGQS